MAGSHRANHRAPRARSGAVSRRALIVAVVVALIPAVWFTAERMVGDDDPTTPSASGTETPIPSVPAKPTTATPTPASPATPRALPRVAPDVPRRLTSGSVLDVGFDDSVEPDGDVIDARTSSEVSRWGSRGEPGSPGADTVYVIGRVADGAAFEDLGRLRVGSTVTVRTDNGRLGYTVRSVASLPRSGAGDQAVFTARVPGRLVLVGVRDAGYLVLLAELTSATPS